MVLEKKPDQLDSQYAFLCFLCLMCIFVAETLDFRGPYLHKSFHMSSHRRLS